jgi:hypothetical protein
MDRTRCTHFTPDEGHCRKRARVRALVVTIAKHSRVHLKHYELTLCWEHYLEMEARARKCNATVEVIYAVPIACVTVDGIEYEITSLPEGDLIVHNVNDGTTATDLP